MAGRSAYDAAALIYEAMAAQAVPVAEVDAELRTSAGHRAAAVWFGSLLALLADLGMPWHLQYDRHRRNLLAMECVRRLRTTGRAPSAWALYRPPTPALWMALDQPARWSRPRPYRAEHARRLATFVRTAAERHPDLVREAIATGARTAPELAAYLAALPESRLRALAPVCLGYLGGPHTCQVPDLDLSVPSRISTGTNSPLSG